MGVAGVLQCLQEALVAVAVALGKPELISQDQVSPIQVLVEVVGQIGL